MKRILINSDNSQRVVARLLFENDIQHIDFIRYHMKSMNILLGFICENKLLEHFEEYFIKRHDGHQEYFKTCYEFSEKYQNLVDLLDDDNNAA